jgi:hypothetical protein
MKYNPDIHHRRSIRLKGYDYSQRGAYFVTLVTHGRQCLFGQIVDGKMQLNEGGEITNQCWMEIPKHYPHVSLDAFVIMPNHVHGIIIIAENDVDDNNIANIVGAIHELPLRNYVMNCPTDMNCPIMNCPHVTIRPRAMNCHINKMN